MYLNQFIKCLNNIYMASIVETPGTLPSPTINLFALEQKIREGLENIQTISSCPLFWNGSEIVDNKEYKKGDEDDKYKDIIKRCLNVSDDVEKKCLIL